MALTPEAQDMLWAQQAGAGDRLAFARLVGRHQGTVRSLLRRLCGGDTALADELAQDSFLAAWQALAGFRGESRLRTWLIRLAYNQFLQHSRRPGSRLQAQCDPLDLDDVRLAHTAASPAAGQDFSLDVERALRLLSPAERDAVLHCCLAQLSHAEAAELLGWPLGTVKSHVLRGRAKLRTALAIWAPPGFQDEEL